MTILDKRSYRSRLVNVSRQGAPKLQFACKNFNLKSAFALHLTSENCVLNEINALPISHNRF